ncbi:MAG: low-specificity L-threonine aldolase [Peptococcaceae bacterium]|nr:low-specificity L-threonine aldolase [Peptococcaceae bacterium]MBS3951113.1 low-specificity L-threonine aldolase [Peptococcaceae bacterium]
MRVIDLRSDTVTLPSAAMREAMAKAAVGDDVYGEDPTVNLLEQRAAELLGKEAALYVSSGTQGNLLALLSHCERGDEVILESESHIFMYEVGGMSALGGLVPRRVDGIKGILQPEAVRANIRSENIHYPRTGLICIENTHNRAGGTVVTVEQTQALATVAREHNLPLHMDGARLYNAAVALGVSVKDLAAPCDSISLCLSKGLGCPVGSVLVGSKSFIAKARKYRKMVGGGMRQAGIIAAAGLLALETGVERLQDDHKNARRLAEGLAKLGVAVDFDSVQTNIVAVKSQSVGLNPAELVQKLDAKGVKSNAMSSEITRFVTHLDISEQDIDEVLTRISQVLK